MRDDNIRHALQVAILHYFQETNPNFTWGQAELLLRELFETRQS